MLYSAAVAVCRPMQVGSKKRDLQGREPGKRGTKQKKKQGNQGKGNPEALLMDLCLLLKTHILQLMGNLGAHIGQNVLSLFVILDKTLCNFPEITKY